jgi:hypothetical protein
MRKRAAFARAIGMDPVPAPRRFMQGMDAWLMLMAGVTLLNGYLIISYIAQGFIAAAFSALLFGKFCVGAYLYHLLTGKSQFANPGISSLRNLQWRNYTSMV